MSTPQASANSTYRDQYGDCARNTVLLRHVDEVLYQTMPVPAQPIEQISSINEITARNLYEAKYSLVNLLGKVRGSQPTSDVPIGVDKDRNLSSDAYALREFSFQILGHLEELHRIVGPTP